jgi:hypothetical protein
MTTTLTLTGSLARVPIGYVTLNGTSVPVAMDAQWTRVFDELITRVGGVVAMSNDELSELALSALNGADSRSADAMRAVEELRIEMASLRGALDEERARVESLAAELAGLRNPPPERPDVMAMLEELSMRPMPDQSIAARVQALEDFLT